MATKAKPTKRPKKKKLGHPTKWSKEMREKILFMARRGFIEKEIAHILDIGPRTLANWKTRYPDFWQELKENKGLADAKVVKSLYERANGYNHRETKAQWVWDQEQGGRWETIDLIKHYPPDTGACIFWLKNRLPEVWRDKQDVEQSGEVRIRVTYDDKLNGENGHRANGTSAETSRASSPVH